MKKYLIALVIAATSLLSGCGENKIIDGKSYSVYGIANEEAKKDPNIVYEISPVSVIVAIVFCETIFVPIYVIGWDLWEPVRKR